MRTCTAGLGCNYQLFGCGKIECSYPSYCDYQLPRDSRVFETIKEVKRKKVKNEPNLEGIK